MEREDIIDDSHKNYISFRKSVDEVCEKLQFYIDICEQLDQKDFKENYLRLQNRLREHTFSVGIMGEFKRGKSTVINALLGQEIVPSDVIPTSATLNRIRYAEEPSACIRFKDGSTKEVKVEELADYVTKLTESAERMAETVEDAIVSFPCDLCRDGVEIIDTPGLNDDERMDMVAEQVIPSLDAIVMVIVPDAPFSKSEADFVRNKLMASDLGRVIFVLNKIDSVRPRDRQKLMDSIKGKIQSSVLDKLASVYGEDSTEYQEAVKKLGEVKLYAISARDALDGRLEADDELLNDSAILTFETALSKLLVEERGMLELTAPINAMRAGLGTCRNAINLRRDGIQMKTAEFLQKQNKLLEQIAVSRRKKEDELEKLRVLAGRAYWDLVPEISGRYNKIEEELCNFVKSYPIPIEKMKSERTKKEYGAQITQDLNAEMQSLLMIETEQIMRKLEERVGDDARKAEITIATLCEDVNKVNEKIDPDKKKTIENIGFGGVASATFLGGMLGIGGMLAGYRENGVKGAIVGGVGAAVTGTVSTFGLLATIGAVSGTLAAPVVLPVMAIGSIISTFGGRAITRSVFKEKSMENDIADLRAAICKNVSNSIISMRKEMAIEKWFKEASDQAYNYFIEALGKEAESVFSGYESTIAQICKEKEAAEIDKNETLQMLMDAETSLNDMEKWIQNFKADYICM